jgi:hypothetical protein
MNNNGKTFILLMKEIKKYPYIKKNKKDFDKIQKLYDECKNRKNCNSGNYDSNNKCVKSKCPKENKLFHNDTSINNICFLRNECVICIIDFGEATLNVPVNVREKGFTKKISADEMPNDNDRKEDFIRWLGINKNKQMTPVGVRYGGKHKKTKQTRKAGKKRKQIKTKKHYNKTKE